MSWASPDEEENFYANHPDMAPKEDRPPLVVVAGPEETAKKHHGQAKYAYRLAAAYGDRLMHVHQLGWHWYDGQRWVEDDSGYAKRAVLEVLRKAHIAAFGDDKRIQAIAKLNSAAAVSGILSIAEALEQFAVTVKDLDADPWALNTSGGTLDLRTMSLSPHNPADRITKMTDGAYDPDVDSSRWDAFLARVLPDADVRAYLQRLAGVALLGTVPEHVLAILKGEGQNGKSVFYEVMASALGEYAVIPESDLLMAKDHPTHSTGMLDLRGRRLAVVSESDEGKRLAEATVKRLTGGDSITARRMRMDNVTFSPSHSVWLVTNHLPRVKGDDPAIWRRLRVVPFDVRIPDEEKDGTLGDRLKAEDASAVLTWAVAGLKDYLARGGLAEPEAVLAETAKYKLDSDAVTRFVNECCHVSPHVFAYVTDLWDRWGKFAAEEGAEHLNQKAFGQELERRGFTAGSNGRRLRRGLELLSEEAEDEAN